MTDRTRAWVLRAACRGCVDMFYSDDPNDRRKAKRLCMRCPVRGECLDEAMAEERAKTHWARSGIRGGLDERERAKLAREQRVAG